MLNIVVIEDDNQDVKILEQCLARYATQNHLQLQAAHFSSALRLINAYKSNYDLIFTDIEMSLILGMRAAKALQQTDRGVTLVLIANMVQYAVEDYAIEVFDYILKPINDYVFDLKLKRILSHVGSQAEERIVIRTGGETVGLPIRRICYVEMNGRYLSWHTQDRICRFLETLKSIRE